MKITHLLIPTALVLSTVALSSESPRRHRKRMLSSSLTQSGEFFKKIFEDTEETTVEEIQASNCSPRSIIMGGEFQKGLDETTDSFSSLGLQKEKPGPKQKSLVHEGGHEDTFLLQSPIGILSHNVKLHKQNLDVLFNKVFELIDANQELEIDGLELARKNLIDALNQEAYDEVKEAAASIREIFQDDFYDDVQVKVLIKSILDRLDKLEKTINKWQRRK